MSLKTIKRVCWWCSNKLMASGHVEVKVHDGTVWVHESCKDAVYGWMHPVTAQPNGGMPVEGIDWRKH